MSKKDDIQKWAQEELRREQEKDIQWTEPVYSEGYKVEMEVHKPGIWEKPPTHRKIRITDTRDRNPYNLTEKLDEE